MLACYCLQGKQLAIGLLTCQSHYNVSGINRTPCARLLLRYPLAQRIPTEMCECSVNVVESPGQVHLIWQSGVAQPGRSYRKGKESDKQRTYVAVTVVHKCNSNWSVFW